MALMRYLDPDGRVHLARREDSGLWERLRGEGSGTGQGRHCEV